MQLQSLRLPRRINKEVLLLSSYDHGTAMDIITDCIGVRWVNSDPGMVNAIKAQIGNLTDAIERTTGTQLSPSVIRDHVADALGLPGLSVATAVAIVTTALMLADSQMPDGHPDAEDPSEELGRCPDDDWGCDDGE